MVDLKGLSFVFVNDRSFLAGNAARQSAITNHKTAEQFQWINDDGDVVEICQVQIPIAVVLRDYSHSKPRPTNSTTSNE
jgi:hypothetical protein